MAPETFSDITVILEFFLLGSNTFHGTWSTRDTKTPRNTGVLLEQTEKGGHRCGYYNNILAAYIKKKHLHVLLKFIANDSW